MLTNGNATH